MALHPAAVIQLHRVALAGSRRGVHLHRSRPGSNRGSSLLQRALENGGVARMVAGQDAGVGLDDRDRHAVAGVHLGQLDAGRAATEDEEALRQLAGRRALSVRPVRDLVQSGQVGDARLRAHGHDDVGPFQLVDDVVVGHHHASRAVQAGRSADDDRADVLEPLDVEGIVGVRDADAVDVVVAPRRGLRPRVVAAAGVDRRRVEQRLRGDARPERAGAADEVAVDDGHAGAALARHVGGRLTGGAGPDDDEVKPIHVRAPRPRSRSGGARRHPCAGRRPPRAQRPTPRGRPPSPPG